jgi:hypothetical protein
MDFMKLFKSLEELLYEVIVMLVFFPKTLWLTVRYPQRMMDYADTELGDVLSEQYKDTLSPPLFLMICVALSYMVEQASPRPPDISALPAILRDSQNLLAFRVLVFSLFPLAFSLRLLKGLGQPLDRDTLRAPFFAQCFVAAPVAMIVGIAQAMRNVPIAYADLISTALLVFAIGWYTRQQAWWLRTKLALPMWRSWAATLGMTLVTVIVFFCLALAIMAFNR